MKITVAQYKDALIRADKNITEQHKQLLQIQYNLPGYRATASQLSELLGVKRWPAINSLYGRLGHILSDELGILPLQRGKTGKYEWWQIIAEGEVTSQGFVWTLKPEFIQALEKLQFISRIPLPENRLFSQTCELILSELNYEKDIRRPPDNLRKGQFKAGWNDAILQGKDYSEETLRNLTWHNLGYRMAQRYGQLSEQEREEIFDAFAQYHLAKQTDKNYLRTLPFRHAAYSHIQETLDKLFPNKNIQHTCLSIFTQAILYADSLGRQRGFTETFF